MNNKHRKKIEIQKIKEAGVLQQITEDELLDENEKYDAENYDPMENLDDKEMLIPENKTEIITIRLTQQENNIITGLAKELGLSKSSYIRMVLRKAIG